MRDADYILIGFWIIFIGVAGFGFTETPEEICENNNCFEPNLNYKIANAVIYSSFGSLIYLAVSFTGLKIWKNMG